MKLTEIVKILDIQPIEGADRIDRARVLGWSVIIRKGLHQVGDLVIFVAPDTMVPKQFLDESYTGTDKIRLKTVRMKGQYSAGLILPLTVLSLPDSVSEGDEVSEELNIEKYEKAIPAQLAGQIVGDFPTFLVSKTDEDNARSNLSALEEMKVLDNEIVISLKMDGTSFSAIYTSEKGLSICSRNYELKYDPNNIFWKLAEKHRLGELLKEHYDSSGEQLSIQGELCASNINGGNTGVVEPTLFVFLISEVSNRHWKSCDQMMRFCDIWDLDHVPEILCGPRFTGKTLPDIEELQKISNDQKYFRSGKPAEGIVLRTNESVPSNSLSKSWLSLKVINQKYID